MTCFGPQSGPRQASLFVESLGKVPTLALGLWVSVQSGSLGGLTPAVDFLKPTSLFPTLSLLGHRSMLRIFLPWLTSGHPSGLRLNVSPCEEPQDPALPPTPHPHPTGSSYHQLAFHPVFSCVELIIVCSCTCLCLMICLMSHHKGSVCPLPHLRAPDTHRKLSGVMVERMHGAPACRIPNSLIGFSFASLLLAA